MKEGDTRKGCRIWCRMREVVSRRTNRAKELRALAAESVNRGLTGHPQRQATRLVARRTVRCAVTLANSPPE